MSLFASIIALSLAGAAPADDYRQRPPEDEIVYFLLPDRFENGDRPCSISFFSGCPTVFNLAIGRTTGAGSKATGSRPAMTPRRRASFTAAISRA